MKKLLHECIVLPIVVLTSITTMFSQPGSVSNISVCEEALTDFGLGTTYTDQDLTIYAGRIGLDVEAYNSESFAIINGILYEDILKKNIENSANGVGNILVGDERISFAGTVNNTAGDYQQRFVSYNKTDLENPLVYLTAWNLYPGSLSNVLGEDGPYWYFIFNGIQAGALMTNGYTFAEGGVDIGMNTSGLPAGLHNGIVRYNEITQTIDAQIYFPINNSTAVIPRKSMVQDSNGNIYLKIYDQTNDQFKINKYSSTLVPITSSDWFPITPELSINATQKLFLTESSGEVILYALGKYVAGNPQQSKGLRKFDVNLVEDTEFNDGTNGSLFFPNNALDMIETENEILVLNALGVTSFDKETGRCSPYRRLSGVYNNGDFVGISPYLSGMHYDAETEQLSIIGHYTAPSNLGAVTFEGMPLPPTTGECGSCELRTIEFDLDVSGIHPLADVDVSVEGYPDATIIREGRHFTISNIPEEAYSSLTLEIEFIDTSSPFVVSPGNGASLTKDFTSDELHFVEVLNSLNYAKIFYYVNYTFSVEDGLSTGENDIEKNFLYPNPTAGTLFVPEAFTNYSLNLYDLQGRNVLQISELGSIIDLGPLPSGMYLAHITSDTGAIKTQKIIKR